MTRSITVYGFGSAFNSDKVPYDIDLLILHQDSDLATCKLAITCKNGLAKSINRTHVTMLSEAEEKHFQFIKAARAVRLGIIRESHFNADLKLISVAVKNFK